VPGQLLLRGAVLATDGRLEKYWMPFATVGLLTLGVIGLWGPSPFSFNQGYEIQYRVDVIDHEGRYVISTGKKETVVYVTMNNVFLSIPKSEMFDAMRENIARELANKIQF
jgi:hypothetical protein